MMRVRLFVFVAAALLILASAPLAAQEGTIDAPLVLWIAGDLYTVHPDMPSLPPRRLTQMGVISGPALSPTGEWVAFKATVPAGPISADDPPSDIYVIDARTGSIAVVAAQPESAPTDGVPDNAVVRSAPAWSPDGARLAWLEFPFGGTEARLMQFDFAQRLTAGTAITVPVIEGRAPEVIWGSGGIALSLDLNVAGDLEFWLITPEDTAPSIALLRPAFDETALVKTWVREGERSLFGVLLSSGWWTLFDPATGAALPAGRIPEMIALRAPETSRALRFSVSSDIGFYWEAHDPLPSEEAMPAFPSDPSRMTLSPDGRAIAFLGYPGYTGAALWIDGHISAISGTGGDGLQVGAMIWGPVEWHVAPES